MVDKSKGFTSSKRRRPERLKVNTFALCVPISFRDLFFFGVLLMTTGKKFVSFFDSPPLLKGEDLESYNQLLAGVKASVTPADFLEEVWTNDVVQETWEIVRWRRSKAALLNSAMPDAVEKLLVGRSLKLLPKAKQIAEAWAAGKRSDVKEVDDLLASGGMTIDDVQARSMELKLKSIDHLDRLTTSAEIRRSNTFREIDRHRDRNKFAKTLRTEIVKIEDETVTTAPQQQPSS